MTGGHYEVHETFSYLEKYFKMAGFKEKNTGGKSNFFIRNCIFFLNTRKIHS